MAEGNGSHERVTKRIRWIARIWSIPLIVGALLVLVGNVLNWVTTGVADPNAREDVPFTEALAPIFLMLSIAGLGVAWRWERLGAGIAVLFQLAALLAILINNPITRDFPRMAIPYILWVIVAIPGVLFVVCWWRTKRAAIPAQDRL